ncbi:hypothetical protein C8R46DRAFT_1026814 [Mycena filopes]|nr:hypothetical protein C8R46DRAFT_1026814 [Mycena filopes]
MSPIFPISNAAGFAHPLFRNLTHLEIVYVHTVEAVADGLALLPRLTHLSFYDNEFGAALAPRLAALPHLQCIVALVRSSEEASERIRTVFARDNRFVCAMRDDFVVDWLAAADDGDVYWTRAEGFLAARRAGRVHGYTVEASNTEWRTWLR